MVLALGSGHWQWGRTSVSWCVHGESWGGIEKAWPWLPFHLWYWEAGTLALVESGASPKKWGQRVRKGGLPLWLSKWSILGMGGAGRVWLVCLRRLFPFLQKFPLHLASKFFTEFWGVLFFFFFFFLYFLFLFFLRIFFFFRSVECVQGRRVFAWDWRVPPARQP